MGSSSLEAHCWKVGGSRDEPGYQGSRPAGRTLGASADPSRPPYRTFEGLKEARIPVLVYVVVVPQSRFPHPIAARPVPEPAWPGRVYGRPAIVAQKSDRVALYDPTLAFRAGRVLDRDHQE